MPALKYKCNDCGKEFAKIFFSLEHAPRECPVCGAAHIDELGPAFTPDREQVERALCVSCDTCETGTCPTVRVSASG